MFTDIVGYTALMGSDENRAFETLKKNRLIHSELIEQFKGTLIKEMGDGMLISFNLASDAVYCAIEIQRKCKEQKLPLKIGIHEGEMVFDDNDVLGDGVNIASRIQDDTKVGCISISGSVYHDIRNKPDIKAEFLEEKKFKNVNEKIKVFRVSWGDEVDGNSKNQHSKKRNIVIAAIGILVIIVAATLVWQFGDLNGTSPPSPEALEDKDKSIAVLPFTNLSEDKENQHFADGLVDDLLNRLALIDEFKVISHTSSDTYRERGKKRIPEIAKELGVTHIVEGSVQKYDNKARITVQLIDAKNDDHLWIKNL